MRFVFLAIAFSFCTSSLAADSRLPDRVRRALDVRGVPHETISIYVTDVDSGATVVSWLPDEARNPASTIKLLTTLAALDILGPAYRWKTELYALGDVSDGRLEGDLLIKGYGDPFLVTERIWRMLRNLRNLGIEHIDGNVLLDDSWFDVAEHDPAAFDRQPLRAYNVAPNALLMNFKVVRYWFEPLHDTNAVRVSVDPRLDNLHVENKLTLVPGSCRGYQRGIAITPNSDTDVMVLSGRFPAGCDRYALDRTALTHNEYVWGLVSGLWREAGGTISGNWKSAVAPADEVPILEYSSLSLAESIARINKHSNNVMARQLMYTLSAELNGAPGTEEGGRQVIADWLAAHGIDSPKLVLDNGACLENRGLPREIWRHS